MLQCVMRLVFGKCAQNKKLKDCSTEAAKEKKMEPLIDANHISNQII